MDSKVDALFQPGFVFRYRHRNCVCTGRIREFAYCSYLGVDFLPTDITFRLNISDLEYYVL